MLCFVWCLCMCCYIIRNDLMIIFKGLFLLTALDLLFKLNQKPLNWTCLPKLLSINSVTYEHLFEAYFFSYFQAIISARWSKQKFLMLFWNCFLAKVNKSEIHDYSIEKYVEWRFPFFYKYDILVSASGLIKIALHVNLYQSRLKIGSESKEFKCEIKHFKSVLDLIKFKG